MATDGSRAARYDGAWMQTAVYRGGDVSRNQAFTRMQIKAT